MKWCVVQHAFPKSAILTDIFSKPVGSFLSLEEDLSREIPETSRVRRSLPGISFIHKESKNTYAVFSRCLCFSSSSFSVFGDELVDPPIAPVIKTGSCGGALLVLTGDSLPSCII